MEGEDTDDVPAFKTILDLYCRRIETQRIEISRLRQALQEATIESIDQKKIEEAMDDVLRERVRLRAARKEVETLKADLQDAEESLRSKTVLTTQLNERLRCVHSELEDEVSRRQKAEKSLDDALCQLQIEGQWREMALVWLSSEMAAGVSTFHFSAHCVRLGWGCLTIDGSRQRLFLPRHYKTFT